MAKVSPYKKTQGKVDGPDHSEGGVNAQKGKKPIAEVEGQERIFSQEDTALIEKACQDILAASESGEQPQADQLAMQLGYKVCEMVQAQDKNQMEQQPADYMEAASNEFANG